MPTTEGGRDKVDDRRIKLLFPLISSGHVNNCNTGVEIDGCDPLSDVEGCLYEGIAHVTPSDHQHVNDSMLSGLNPIPSEEM